MNLVHDFEAPAQLRATHQIRISIRGTIISDWKNIAANNIKNNQHFMSQTYRGSPTYMKTTNAVPNFRGFGLCTCKCEIFGLVWDLLQSHQRKFWSKSQNLCNAGSLKNELLIAGHWHPSFQHWDFSAISWSVGELTKGDSDVYKKNFCLPPSFAQSKLKYD